MKNINHDDLVPLNIFVQDFPVTIDLVYAHENHPENIFGKIYHSGALMWLHKDLAKTLLCAALVAKKNKGWSYRICDALRPVDAQNLMQDAGVHPILLSKPGCGGHPRGLAFDLTVMDADGSSVDMGTPFDHFAKDPENDNPAARNYPDFTAEIQQNRKFLENDIVGAGRKLGLPIWPLSFEWWDFRYPLDLVKQYAPLHEKDLHPYQRMLNPDLEQIQKILNHDFPDAVNQAISEVRQTVHQFTSNDL